MRPGRTSRSTRLITNCAVSLRGNAHKGLKLRPSLRSVELYIRSPRSHSHQQAPLVNRIGCLDFTRHSFLGLTSLKNRGNNPKNLVNSIDLSPSMYGTEIPSPHPGSPR